MSRAKFLLPCTQCTRDAWDYGTLRGVFEKWGAEQPIRQPNKLTKKPAASHYDCLPYTAWFVNYQYLFTVSSKPVSSGGSIDLRTVSVPIKRPRGGKSQESFSLDFGFILPPKAQANRTCVNKTKYKYCQIPIHTLALFSSHQY